MIAGTLMKIALLFLCLAALQILLRQRLLRKGSAPPAPCPASAAAKQTAVLSTAQRVTAGEPFDFLPFFRLEYPEQTDRMNVQQRHWAQEAIALFQQQDLAVLPQVMEYARRIKDQYPQFYFGYYAAALALQRQGDFKAACRELEAGIPLSHQKYTLYAALGSSLYDHGDMNPALGWWIRSAVSQASIRSPGLSVPFVLLGYAARYRNLTKIADALFAVARQVDSKPPLLNEQAEDKLRTQLREKGSDTVHQALVLLYTEYLPALLG